MEPTQIYLNSVALPRVITSLEELHSSCEPIPSSLAINQVPMSMIRWSRQRDRRRAADIVVCLVRFVLLRLVMHINHKKKTQKGKKRKRISCIIRECMQTLTYIYKLDVCEYYELCSYIIKSSFLQITNMAMFPTYICPITNNQYFRLEIVSLMANTFPI